MTEMMKTMTLTVADFKKGDRVECTATVTYNTTPTGARGTVHKVTTGYVYVDWDYEAGDSGGINPRNIKHIYEPVKITVDHYPRYSAALFGAFVDISNELGSAIQKHTYEQTPLNPEVSREAAFIILAEEFGEVARAVTRDGVNKENLQEELVQVAAMAVAMLIGERGRKNG